MRQFARDEAASVVALVSGVGAAGLAGFVFGQELASRRVVVVALDALVEAGLLDKPVYFVVAEPVVHAVFVLEQGEAVGFGVLVEAGVAGGIPALCQTVVGVVGEVLAIVLRGDDGGEAAFVVAFVAGDLSEGVGDFGQRSPAVVAVAGGFVGAVGVGGELAAEVPFEVFDAATRVDVPLGQVGKGGGARFRGQGSGVLRGCRRGG
jgi:hypothetical protein